MGILPMQNRFRRLVRQFLYRCQVEKTLAGFCLREGIRRFVLPSLPLECHLHHSSFSDTQEQSLGERNLLLRIGSAVFGTIGG